MRTTTRILLFTIFLLGTPTAAAFALPPLPSPPPLPSVDVGFFYDDLAPYGYWYDSPSYGWAWKPREVETSWRPYQDGHWALTDAGWTCISDEPFGWATYHYGRWYSDPVYGWSWIPGDECAPAQVSWRESDDYIGWAPLPPPRVDLLPASFVFVPARSFLAPDVFVTAVPLVESVRIFPRTRTVTTYRFVNRRFVNFGVPVARVQRLVGRPVPVYQVVDLSPDFRHRGARIAGNRVAFFRPRVAKVHVAPPPGRPVARGALLTPRTAAHIKAAQVRGHALALSHNPPLVRTTQLRRQDEKTERRHMMTRGTIAQDGRRVEHGSIRQQRMVHERSAKGPERHRIAAGPRSRHEVRQMRSTGSHQQRGRSMQSSPKHREVGRQHVRSSQRSSARHEIARVPQGHSKQRLQGPRQVERHRGGAGPRPPRGAMRGGGGHHGGGHGKRRGGG